jgi:hypothetical protein
MRRAEGAGGVGGFVVGAAEHRAIGVAPAGGCTYVGEAVKCGTGVRHGGRSGDVFVEAVEEAVEDLGPADLSFGGGVLALFAQRRSELDGGDEEGAGLADGLEVAVHLDRAGAVAVAEHAAMHLTAEFAHLVALVAVGQLAGLAVEGFDLLGDGEVLVGDRLVRDARVDHRHGERLVAEQRGDGVEAHAPVDRLGGQGVAELVGGDVPDPGFVAELARGGGDPQRGDGAVVTRAPRSGPRVVGVQRRACWAGGHDHDEATPAHPWSARPYIEPGSPWENPFIESFNGRVRDELLNGEEFGSFLEAWRVEYNTYRPPSSLGGLTPAEYPNAWATNQPALP